jgi:Dolichyl-phosphate-mannose-protein mannosyltransferase
VARRASQLNSRDVSLFATWTRQLAPHTRGDWGLVLTVIGTRRSAWARSLAGVGLAVLLTVFMHDVTATTLSTTLPWNQGDPALNTWVLDWESHAFLHEPSNFFNGNIFFPFGEALKYSELMLPLMPPFWLIDALSGNPILAHNLVLLGLSVFCLLSTYLLVRRLVGSEAAILGAVSFTYSGYVFMHQTHLQLLTLGFFPLAFLALFRMLERRRVRDGVFLGVSTALLTTASLYYGAIWVVCLCLILVADAVRIRWPDRSWLLAGGSAIGVSTLLIGPIAYVYGEFQSRVPFVRDPTGFGIRPLDFLTPAPGSLLYPNLFEWATARQPGSVVEHGFFLGFAVLSLAVAGGMMFVLTMRRPNNARLGRANREIAYLALAGAVSLVIALGPSVHGIRMPFSLFHDFVPGFGSIRAVSRLAVPALLTAGVLASWLLAKLTGRLSTDTALLVVTGVVAFALLEMFVRPMPSTVEATPDVMVRLSEAPPGAAIELPMRQVFDAKYALIEGSRMLSSLGDWRRRFNGYSGAAPPGYLDVIEEVSRFPQPSAIRVLKDLHIRYVVLHGEGDSKESDAAYSPEEIMGIVSSLPASTSATQAGDSWLVDLTPTS